MKAKVTIPDGFRYYRHDNTHVDVKDGQEIEADDIPTRDRRARFDAGHLEEIGGKAKAKAKAEPEADETTKGKK
jgi:hypothetical protein